MTYRMFTVLCFVQGAFLMLSGGANAVRELSQEADRVGLLVFSLMFIVGLGLLLRGRIALVLSGLLAACFLGLAGWMLVIVARHDGDWSIYGEMSTLFHGLLVFLGLYNAVILVCGYASRGAIFATPDRG